MQPGPILIVEDNEDDLFFLKRSLAKVVAGESFAVVTDGQEALNYLLGRGEFVNRTVHPMPRIVFLDLKLPYVLGLDVLATIRGTNGLSELPVVVLTSSSQDSDMDRARVLGAKAYLVKPATEAALRAAVTDSSECTASRSQ